MLRAAKPPLRNSPPPLAATNLRRISAAGQKAGWVVLLKCCCKSEISVLTVPSTSEQSPLCSDVFLCLWQKRRHPPAPLLLLSNCDPLRWARSWCAALRAAFFSILRNIDFDRSFQLVASVISLATSFFLSGQNSSRSRRCPSLLNRTAAGAAAWNRPAGSVIYNKFTAYSFQTLKNFPGTKIFLLVSIDVQPREFSHLFVISNKKVLLFCD